MADIERTRNGEQTRSLDQVGQMLTIVGSDRTGRGRAGRRDHDRRHDHLEVMLASLEWPLPAQLGARWLDRVADRYLAAALTKEAILAAMVDQYRRHALADLRRLWLDDPQIAGRRTILIDALTAHEEERFTLSVPALLAQIEGVIVSVHKQHGRFTTRDLQQRLEPVRVHGSRFQRLASKYVETTLWSTFGYGYPMPALGRHAVLHGADTNYATAANSLRAILAFDNIRSVLALLAPREVEADAASLSASAS